MYFSIADLSLTSAREGFLSVPLRKSLLNTTAQNGVSTVVTASTELFYKYIYIFNKKRVVKGEDSACWLAQITARQQPCARRGEDISPRCIESKLYNSFCEAELGTTTQRSGVSRNQGQLGGRGWGVPPDTHSM